MSETNKKLLWLVVALAAVCIAAFSVMRSSQGEVGKAGAYYGNKDPNAKSPKQLEMENSLGKKPQADPNGIDQSKVQRSESPGN